MSLRPGPKRVVAPDGVEWRVGRRWVTRRPNLLVPSRGEIASESLSNLGSGLPGVGNLDFGEGLLIVAAIVAVAVILIPVLFFGLELIIVGVLLAAGVLGRTLLRQPWVVEARAIDPLASERRLEWRVRGWRKSSDLIAQVASDLSSGHDPANRELSA